MDHFKQSIARAICGSIAGRIAVSLMGLLIAGHAVRPARAANELPILTTVKQVKELSAEQAGRKYPVHLKAVITCSEPASSLLFVLDSTGGIYVLAPDIELPLARGQQVEVQGVTAFGFSNYVIKAKLKFVGKAELPRARRVTLEGFNKGEEDGNWIELEGVVRGWSRDGGHESLLLSGGAHQARISVRNKSVLEATVQKLVDAKVRIRGTCGVSAAGKELEHAVLFVMNLDADVSILEAAPPDPFKQKITPLAQIPIDSEHRIKVRAQVASHTEGEELVLRDGDCLVKVRTPQTTPVEPGDLVEVLGFPDRDRSNTILKYAIYRLVALKKSAAEALPSIPSSDDYLPILQTVREVRNLSAVDAKMGFPVRIRGIVTYYDPDWQNLFIQDTDQGIYVTPSKPLPVRKGQYVELNGYRAPEITRQ